MRIISDPNGDQIRRHDKDSIALYRENRPVGFVTCVQGVHVVLLGPTPESSVEISQHVRADHALDALLEACTLARPAKEAAEAETTPPSRLAPVSPLVRNRPRHTAIARRQSLTG